MIASDALEGSMESSVQLDVVNVGVLVALNQISRGMRKMIMLTNNTIHLSLEYYFSNFNLILSLMSVIREKIRLKFEKCNVCMI